jgi:sulfotransferase family protein
VGAPAIGHELVTDPTSDFRRPNGPLFVIGMWRSGTSALYALLNQHAKIALLFEGDLRLLSWRFLFSPSPAKVLARWNFWNLAAKRHQIQVERLAQAMPDVRSAMEATYREYAERKGASIRGEKSPNYYDCLTDLAKDFPGARFLVIWRNPMSVCASILSARAVCSYFNRTGMVLRALLGFPRLKQQCDRLLEQNVPVHQINYEELVEDPSTVMKGICRFLEIGFDPKMTSLDEADVSAIYLEDHHSSFLRREDIHLMPEQTYLLPPAVRRKIRRYVCEWKEKSGGVWPAYPRAASGREMKPSTTEKLLDQIAYRCLRAYDQMVLVLYGLGPIWGLQRYRAIKQHCRKFKQNRRRNFSRWPSPAGNSKSVAHESVGAVRLISSPGIRGSRN